MEIKLAEQQLKLLSEKAIYWTSQEALIISDLHLGKASHFRKSGIAIPELAEKKDLQILTRTIRRHKPKKIYFLGDLFHSEYNTSWDQFCNWCSTYDAIDFYLIQGNHDILAPEMFERAGLKMVQELLIDSILLTHDEVKTEYFNIHGHIHPGYKVNLGAKQKTTLACFALFKHKLIMPAFGSFNGFVTINQLNADQIFLIVDNELIELPLIL